MGRSIGKLQCAGTLVVAVACSFTPAAHAHDVQVIVPIADLHVEIDVDVAPAQPVTAPTPPAAPTPPSDPPPRNMPPQPAEGDQPVVPVVVVEAAADSPAPQQAPDVALAPNGATGSDENSTMSNTAPSSPRMPISMPRAPSAPPASDGSANDDPRHPASVSMRSGRGDSSMTFAPGTTAALVVTGATASANAMERVSTSPATSQATPIRNVTSDPAGVLAVSAANSSAPAGIVPHVDAPPARFASQVVDDFQHPWCSYHDVLRIERPG